MNTEARPSFYSQTLVENPMEERSVPIKLYKVSSAGQVTFPATTRRRWGLIDGGFIESSYFGEGVLILPVGSSTRLLESMFPYMVPGTRPTKAEQIADLRAFFNGDRSKTARFSSVTDNVPPVRDPGQGRINAMLDTFKPYKISTVGQMAFPAEARRDWGLITGGTVVIIDFSNFVLLLPESRKTLTRYDINKLIPPDSLLALGDPSKDLQGPHSRDLNNYREWCNKLAAAVLGMSRTFISDELAVGGSAFDARVRKAVILDVIEAAQRQLKQ